MSNMLIYTENSVYEADVRNRRIRRIRGRGKPTPRFTPDGEWKDYDRIEDWMEGKVILWPGSGYTLTSPVKKIEFVGDGVTPEGVQ